MTTHDLRSETYSDASRSTRSLDDETFKEVVEFIDANLARRISTNDLSALAGMSRYHFSRCFSVSAGVPPYTFVTRRRMARARALLIETSLSHEEIAARVGFSHMGHFRGQFRKHVGANPSDARRARQFD